MKFITLEFKNLASLDNPDGETINFEKGVLGQSTIFSIVGPTGSGKSTILDAICLALFNRAPRYPKERGERNQKITVYGMADTAENSRLAPTDCRNILTRGRKEGYSRLTFLANDGHTYRAEWSVRFRVKRFDNTETALYRITAAEGGIKEENLDWELLPEIIGLDYEQFLRTVLLAQGSFANFLKAREDERCALLERLVGSGDSLSRIAEGIREHRRLATESLNTIEGSLAAYTKDDLAEEDFKALEAEIARLEDEKSKGDMQLETVRKQLEWYSVESDLVKADNAFGKALEDAARQLREMDDERRRLEEHTVAGDAVNILRAAEAKTKEAAAVEVKIKSLQNDIKTREDGIAKEESVLKELGEAAETRRKELNDRKPAIDRARTIQGVIKASLSVLENSRQTAAKAAADRKEAENALDRNTKAIAEAETALEKADSTLNTLRNETLKTGDELAKAMSRAEEDYASASENLTGKNPDAMAREKNEADAGLIALKEAARVCTELAACRLAIAECDCEGERLTARIAEIDSRLETMDLKGLKDEIDRLNHNVTLLRSSDLAAQRAELEEGKECPLCGATAHPYANRSVFEPVVSDLTGLIDEKQKALAEKEKERDELTAERGKNSGELKQILKNAESQKRKSDELDTAWRAVSGRHPEWKPDAEWLKALLPPAEERVMAAEKSLAEYNKDLKNANALLKKRDKARRSFESYREESERRIRDAEQAAVKAATLLETERAKTENLTASRIEKDLAKKTADAAVKVAADAIDVKKQELTAEIGNTDPDSFEKRLVSAKDDAETRVTDATEAVTKMRTDLQGVRGRLKEAEENLTAMRAEAKALGDKLENWLDEYNSLCLVTAGRTPMTHEDIVRIGGYDDDWSGLAKRLERRRDAVKAAETTLENSRKTLESHLKTRPEVSREEIEKTRSELETRDLKPLEEARARLAGCLRAREKMGQMANELDKARNRVRECSELVDAVGADGRILRRISQIDTLRFLITHANDEIRKFNSRYELMQVKDSLGIRVIDHDRADDVRDTTSLSGGETFIVSLGLALGLSAISSRNVSFSNLFVDEGFGTLDPDSLATVIDSLAMLQSSQGKKVGVISHTDTMSERITTQIRIVKVGNSGSSRIEFSS